MTNKMILQIRGGMLSKLEGDVLKYCIFSSPTSNRTLFHFTSKYELKMWMDLNGFKLGNICNKGKNFVWRQYELIENDS